MDEIRLSFSNEKMIQKELAEKVGLKRSYIAKIEAGQMDIQVSNLFKLLLGLNLNSLDLSKFGH